MSACRRFPTGGIVDVPVLPGPEGRLHTTERERHLNPDLRGSRPRQVIGFRRNR
jgi:hypothetical protein